MENGGERKLWKGRNDGEEEDNEMGFWRGVSVATVKNGGGLPPYLGSWMYMCLSVVRNHQV